MSKDIEKKRKRNDEEGGERSSRVQKAPKINEDSVVENQDASHIKKKGESRQAKSERRSKKTKSADERKGEEKKSRSEKTSAASDPPTTTDTTTAAVAEVDETPDDHGGAVIPEQSVAPNDKVVVKEKKAKKTKESSASARFIVFVGNLPYDVTIPQIEEHFQKVAPFQVRHRVDKNTGQSRGFAFIEFEDYDKMKTTLQLYHHSIFDPNAKEKGLEGEEHLKSDRRKGRKLNVELTAGGGGSKSQGRKDKIKAKNEKLTEQRARKRKAEQEKAVKGKNDKSTTDTQQQQRPENSGSIHPSRMSRVHG